VALRGDRPAPAVDWRGREAHGPEVPS
jgi:hypothetical protein